MRRDSQSDEQIALAERWWRENRARVQKWLAEREQFASQHGAKPKHFGFVPADAEKDIYLRTSTFSTLETIYYAVTSGVENRYTYSWLPVYSKTEHLHTPMTHQFNGSEWTSDGGDWADYTTYHVYPFVPNPDYVRQMNLRAEADYYALWLPHPRDEGIPIGIYDPKGSCVFEGIRYRSYEDEGKDFNTASQAVMKQFEALPGHLQSKY